MTTLEPTDEPLDLKGWTVSGLRLALKWAADHHLDPVGYVATELLVTRDEAALLVKKYGEGR